MRVLVFSTDDHLYPAGGAEQAFGNVSERLPHIEFDLICARIGPEVKPFERVKNVNIYRMGFGVPKLDGIILALFGHYCAKKLMRKHSYDLIWSIMASYGAFAAVRVKKRTGLPFLLTLQEGDSFEHIYRRVRFVRKAFGNIFRQADGVQASSRYLLSWGRDMGYGGTQGRIIPNGVALEAFGGEIHPTKVEEARRSFGFSSDAFILMTSSRLEKKNGVGDVVGALAKLPPHVCFVICGSGSLETDIRKQVNDLGLDTRVKFMGFVNPADVPLYMKASDAFIRPSLSEGLGTAFLEAMCAKLPVIGTPVGGIPDFLQDGVTGLMTNVEDPESVKETVVRLLALSNSERSAMVERAAAMVRTRHDWHLIAKDMESLFKELTV